MVKKISKLFTLTILFISLSNCSSVDVVDTWTGDNVSTIKSQNVLVIARTANNSIRHKFEEQIAKRLRTKDINAIESYKKFPTINPDKKITEERAGKIKEMINEAGFNAVVLSVLKDVEVLEKTTREGGYEAGASVSSYYYYNNIGFYGYYMDPVAFPSYEGVYQEETFTTQTAKILVLETTAYNLDLPKDKQLIATVTSKIDDPSNIQNLADDYAKAILKSLKKK